MGNCHLGSRPWENAFGKYLTPIEKELGLGRGGGAGLGRGNFEIVEGRKGLGLGRGGEG